MTSKRKPTTRTSARARLPEGVEIDVAPLSQFVQDPHNLNDHTPRGHSMLTSEIEENGVGRSLFVSADGVTLAGNLTQEVMGEVMGDPRAVIIKTRGNVPIIHQRLDLQSDDPRARRMAFADNWIAAKSLNFDPAAIAALDPAITDRLMFADEIMEFI